MKKLKPYGKIKQQRAYRKALIVTVLCAFTAVGSVYFAFWYETKDAQAQVNWVKAEKVEIPMRDYVLNEVKKAGLDPEEANFIISKESNWRPDICIIEPNSTISCGLWMLNTVHNKKGLTNACKTDYKCATKFAIEKRLHDGNWNAWTTWKNNYY